MGRFYIESIMLYDYAIASDGLPLTGMYIGFRKTKQGGIADGVGFSISDIGAIHFEINKKHNMGSENYSFEDAFEHGKTILRICSNVLAHENDKAFGECFREIGVVGINLDFQESELIRLTETGLDYIDGEDFHRYVIAHETSHFFIPQTPEFTRPYPKAPLSWEKWSKLIEVIAHEKEFLHIAAKHFVNISPFDLTPQQQNNEKLRFLTNEYQRVWNGSGSFAYYLRTNRNNEWEAFFSRRPNNFNEAFSKLDQEGSNGRINPELYTSPVPHNELFYLTEQMCEKYFYGDRSISITPPLHPEIFTLVKHVDIGMVQHPFPHLDSVVEQCDETTVKNANSPIKYEWFERFFLTTPELAQVEVKERQSYVWGSGKPTSLVLAKKPEEKALVEVDGTKLKSFKDDFEKTNSLIMELQMYYR